jgi:hypothetical protein
MQLSKLAPSTTWAPIRLRDIVTPGYTFPAKVYREYKVPASQWGMLGNDTVGDCIVAMIIHWLMCITAHTGTMITLTTQEAVTIYSAISGYDPNAPLDAQGNNSTDTGLTIAQLMQYMMSTGIRGLKITAWADVDITNPDEQKYGMYTFGGTLDAVNLPDSAMQQFNDDQAWSVLPDDGGIDGGHGIVGLGYGRLGTDDVTWAKLQEITWQWRLKYLMECAVAITPAWISQATQTAPNGLNMPVLMAKIAALGQGG